MAAAHTELGEVTLRLHRALMDHTFLEAQTQHSRIRFFTVEDALDFTI